MHPSIAAWSQAEEAALVRGLAAIDGQGAFDVIVGIDVQPRQLAATKSSSMQHSKNRHPHMRSVITALARGLA